MSEILFSDAIDDIYTASTSVGAWPKALQSIADCFDAKGCVLIAQRGTATLISVVSPGLEDAGAEYNAGAWKDDFLAQRAVFYGIVEQEPVFTERHLASPAEIATHPFFTGFRRRHGLGSFMAACLSPHVDVRVVISMQGSASGAPFSDEDCERFERLTRHVERALMLSCRVLEAETELVALSQILDRLSCGYFILDDDGHVISSNARAREMLGAHLTISESRLLVAASPEDRPLPVAAVMKDGVDGSDSKPLPPLALEKDGRLHMAAYVLPIRQPVTNDLEHVLQGANMLVLTFEADSQGKAEPALLRDLLGITLGEARLASLIASGVAVSEAAQELEITEGSARTILKRVFAKTKLTRQTELANLISRLAVRDG